MRPPSVRRPLGHEHPTQVASLHSRKFRDRKGPDKFPAPRAHETASARHPYPRKPTTLPREREPSGSAADCALTAAPPPRYIDSSIHTRSRPMAGKSIKNKDKYEALKRKGM